MSYVFGKSFSREFSPVDREGNAFKLPAQTPAIYVFKDQPSRDDAAAGTGALQTIATWTQSKSAPYTCTYTVAAIDDPNPASQFLGVEDTIFWEAINCVTAEGEQTQTILRAFLVERPLGLPEVPATTVDDVKAVFPAISEYLTDAQITSFLSLAEEELRLDLENRGYVWGKIHNLKRAKLPLAYKVIELAALSQIKDSGDRFAIRADIFGKRYHAFVSGVTFTYDRDDDGKAEDEAETSKNYVLIER